MDGVHDFRSIEDFQQLSQNADKYDHMSNLHSFVSHNRVA